jgi:hypothetical protein
MIDGRSEGKSDGDSSAPEPRHRFAFGRRWERKKKARSLRKAWTVLLLDLALLLIISLMAWMLVERLT